MPCDNKHLQGKTAGGDTLKPANKTYQISSQFRLKQAVVVQSRLLDHTISFFLASGRPNNNRLCCPDGAGDLLKCIVFRRDTPSFFTLQPGRQSCFTSLIDRNT